MVHMLPQFLKVAGKKERMEEDGEEEGRQRQEQHLVSEAYFGPVGREAFCIRYLI